jgi:biotin carboxyl carrier protein
VKYFVEIAGREHEVDLEERLGQLSVTVDGDSVGLSYDDIDDQGQLLVISRGQSYGVSIEGDQNRIGITIAGHLYDVRIEDERERAAHAAERAEASAGGLVKAVMPGVVVQVLVEVGAEVAAGEPLLILEAMKMQNEIGAPSAGVVQELHVSKGEAVSAGARLITLSSSEEEDA